MVRYGGPPFVVLMGEQPETRLVRRIRKAILAEWPHAWVFKVHGGEYQTAGVPDLIVCVDGYFVGLEVKDRKRGESEQHARDRATPTQRNQIWLIRRAGGVAAVVLSPGEAITAIRQALRAVPIIDL